MLSVLLGHFPGGVPYIEYLPTQEKDPAHVLIPDGSGGVQWWPISSLPGVGSPLMWGANDIGVVETALYLLPGYGADTVATSKAIEMRAPRAGTLRNLHVRQNVFFGAFSETIFYSLLKNGAPTGLLVSIAGTTNDGEDIVHTVPVARGDRLTILVTKSARLTTGYVLGVVATAEFD
jgi:hypothetical protein